MTEKMVHLMRGLPSCGKSHTARAIAGAEGVVCETDAYFYSEVGEDPNRYDYRRDLLVTARQWNLDRFTRAIDDGVPLVVVDRGNSLSADSQRYARYALDHGYRVQLTEPQSPWWQEIRVLLKYKRHTKPVLVVWAERLAQLNRRTHRVPVKQILRLMARWRYDLTVEDILNFRERQMRPSDSRVAEGLNMEHVVGTEKAGSEARRFDPMGVPKAAGIPVLQSDFGQTTGASDPRYFDPANADDAGNDGNYDGEPSRPDMIFDEETGTFSRESGDDAAWAIDAEALKSREGAAAEAQDDWIIRDLDFGVGEGPSNEDEP